MSSLHIYAAGAQPLTRWRLGPEIIDPPSRWFRCSPRKQYYCDVCGRRRWAKHMKIHVYYDKSIITCVEPDAHTTERVPYSVWSKR